MPLSVRGHAAFFLETVRCRLLRTLSDARQDAYVHGGRVSGVLRVIAGIFVRRGARIDPRVLARVYRRLARRVVPDVRQRWGTLYDRAPFGELVYAAQEIAKDLGLS